MESLIILQGQDRGSSFHLTPETISIGREDHNDIILRDREVSRYHAEIRFENDGRKIVDLNSSNGVYINGERVMSRQLADGDRIQIGRTLFHYINRTDISSGSISVESHNPKFFVDSKPDQSRIIHTMSQEEGEKFFQITHAGLQDNDWFNRAKSHLNLIYHTTLVVSQTPDIESLLRRIMDLIFEWVQVDRGCVLLYSPEENSLVPTISKTRRINDKPVRLTISQTILDYVLRQNEGVLTSDAQKDNRWDSADSIVNMGIREAICVPMRGRYGLVGVIYIDTSRRKTPLGRESSSSLQHDAPMEMPKKMNEVPFPVNTLSESLPPGHIPIAENIAIQDNIPVAPDKTDEDLFSFPDAANNHCQLTPDHLKLMIAIGHQAALAVEDTRYYLGMVQAERLAAVGQTTAILSHHIKNILQGIRGGSYLIDLGLKEHEESYIMKGWRIVEKNQNKISDLILDMLTFSKERTPIFSENDLNETLSDVVELMRGRCLDLNVEVHWTPDPNLPRFQFDAEQIHRAITNLVTNAIDAVNNHSNTDQSDVVPVPNMDESAISEGSFPDQNQNEGPLSESKPTVEIRTMFAPQTSMALIIVDDNGPGIPPEARDVLFRPFISKNKSSGTGLGLAVTNKIIHEHNGRVEISGAPIGGARFVVELPLEQNKPENKNE